MVLLHHKIYFYSNPTATTSELLIAALNQKFKKKSSSEYFIRGIFHLFPVVNVVSLHKKKKIGHLSTTLGCICIHGNTQRISTFLSVWGENNCILIFTDCFRSNHCVVRQKMIFTDFFCLITARLDKNNTSFRGLSSIKKHLMCFSLHLSIYLMAEGRGGEGGFEKPLSLNLM